MPNLSNSVAELFATLGLDDTEFNRKLSAAEAKITRSASNMAVPIERISSLLQEVGEHEFSNLDRQFSELKAAGLSAAEAISAISAAEEVMAKRGEALARELSDVQKREIAEQLSARKTAAAEAAFEEESASKARTSAFMQDLAAMEAAFVREKEAEVEAARVAAAEQAAINRSLTSGAYALGGYGAGRAASSLMAGVSPGMVGAAVGVISAYELAKFSGEATKAALATQNLAEQMGITVVQARALEYGAEISGTGIGAVQQAAGRLAQALDEGTTAGNKTAKAMHDLGVEGHTSGQLILSLIQKLSEIPDQERRIAATHEVLQRAAGGFVPYITNLETIKRIEEELGLRTNPALIKSEADAARATNSLGVAWDELKRKIVETMGIPGLVQWLDTMVTKFNKAVGEKPLRYIRNEGEAMSPRDLALLDEIERRRVARAAKDQMAADAEVARQRSANHVKTLDELQEELAAEKLNSHEMDRILNRTVSPVGPTTSPTRAQVEEAYNNSVANVKRLQALIDAQTGKGENTRAELVKLSDSYATVVDSFTSSQQEVMAQSMNHINDLISAGVNSGQVRAAIRLATEDLERFKNDVVVRKKEETARLALEGASQAIDQFQERVAASRVRIGDDLQATIALLISKLRDMVAAGMDPRVISESLKGVAGIYKLFTDSAENAVRTQKQLTEEVQKFDAEERRRQKQKPELPYAQDRIDPSLAARLQQAAVTAPALIEIDKAMKQLGVTSQYSLDLTAAKSRIAYAELLTLKPTVDEANAAFIRMKDAEIVADEGLKPLAPDFVKLREEIVRLNTQGSLSGRITDLTNLEIHTRMLQISTAGLGGIYRDMVHTMEQSLGQVGRVLAGGILDPANFTKNWKSALHSIEEELLGTFLQDLLDRKSVV